MRLLVAVLFLTQAAANSDDVMTNPKSVNPETFMNVVSQENIGSPLYLNVCRYLTG